MFGQTTDKLTPISRRFFLATIILVVIGFCVTIFGACFPYWYAVKDVIHGGVFQICGWTFKNCDATNDNGTKYKDVDLYKLLWGLTITGMLLLLTAMVFLFLYPLQKTVNYCKIATGIFMSVFLVIGIILIMTALIVDVDFGVWLGRSLANVFEDISWAWYITLLGLVILVAGFICFMLHMFFMMYGAAVAPDPVGGYTQQQEYSNRDYYGRQRRY